MALEGVSRLYKHPKAHTLYLTIPAAITRDSQFGLKAGDRVSLVYYNKGAWMGTLVIKKIEETAHEPK